MQNQDVKMTIANNPSNIDITNTLPDDFTSKWISGENSDVENYLKRFIKAPR